LAKNRVTSEKNSDRIIKNERKREKSVTFGFFDKSDNREKQGSRYDLNSEPCAGEQTTSPFQQTVCFEQARRVAGAIRKGAVPTPDLMSAACFGTLLPEP